MQCLASDHVLPIGFFFFLTHPIFPHPIFLRLLLNHLLPLFEIQMNRESAFDKHLTNKLPIIVDMHAKGTGVTFTEGLLMGFCF